MRGILTSDSRVVGIAVAAYVALVLAASFHFNIPLTPDRIIVLLLIVALGTGRIRAFLRDWSIFLIVLLAWQVLSAFSRNIGHLKPHVTEMIVVDKFLFFGQVPTLWLQHHFYHPGHLAWYDVAATVVYLMHFAFPMAAAFALWIWRRQVFIEFMMSFLFLALAGFATYVVFPAAPPWVAANWWHYLPHVSRIVQAGVHFFGGKASFSSFYVFLWQHGGWDVFGAMPSEHAALPFLCFLYLRRVWRPAGWLLIPYCAAVWIAVVYTGEHYVADVIAGVVYAIAAYVLVQAILARRLDLRLRTDGPAGQPAESGSELAASSGTISDRLMY
jgi:membrane-associated phospholipid phosphatase